MKTIYDAIKEDHEKHRRILAELDGTSGDSEKRRELFARLRRELTAHANAEEQTFYAALIEDPDSQEQARHSIAEHKDADNLLEELDELEFDNPGWLQKYRKLKDSVEHYMEEEEEDVFGVARDVIGEPQSQQLASKFANREESEREDA